MTKRERKGTRAGGEGMKFEKETAKAYPAGRTPPLPRPKIPPPQFFAYGHS